MSVKLKALLASRKFWAAVVGVGVIVLRSLVPNFPVADEQITELVGVIIAFILGTALEDGLARINKIS